MLGFVSICAVLVFLSRPIVAAAQSGDRQNATTYQRRGSEGYAADFGGRNTLRWRPQWLKAIVSAPELRTERIVKAEEALHSISLNA